jgi:hypothetical protein
LHVDEKVELERLLLIKQQWEKLVTPAVPALNAPTTARDEAQTNEKESKARESKPVAIEPQRHFIDRICPEGSDKPSGKALGKDSWMG